MSEIENCIVEEHLNENVRGLTPSATVAINDRSNELRRSGRDVFKLGLGQSPCPVPDIVVESLRKHAGEKDYLPVQVHEALRQAEQLTARIACVDFDGREALSDASQCPADLPLDDSFARRHCSRTVEAVDRICTWAQAD